MRSRGKVQEKECKGNCSGYGSSNGWVWDGTARESSGRRLLGPEGGRDLWEPVGSGQGT